MKTVFEGEITVFCLFLHVLTSFATFETFCSLLTFLKKVVASIDATFRARDMSFATIISHFCKTCESLHMMNIYIVPVQATCSLFREMTKMKKTKKWKVAQHTSHICKHARAELFTHAQMHTFDTFGRFGEFAFFWLRRLLLSYDTFEQNWKFWKSWKLKFMFWKTQKCSSVSRENVRATRQVRPSFAHFCKHARTFLHRIFWRRLYRGAHVNCRKSQKRKKWKNEKLSWVARISWNTSRFFAKIMKIWSTHFSKIFQDFDILSFLKNHEKFMFWQLFSKVAEPERSEIFLHFCRFKGRRSVHMLRAHETRGLKSHKDRWSRDDDMCLSPGCHVTRDRRVTWHARKNGVRNLDLGVRQTRTPRVPEEILDSLEGNQNR